MFEWGECSGAVLAKMLADRMASVPDIPDTPDGDAEIFAMVRASRRAAGSQAATQARLVATVYERALAEHRAFGLVQRDGRGQSAAGPSHRYDDEVYTRSEIAANLSLELGVTLTAADRMVAFALGLCRRPELWQALATGRIDADQAMAVVDELAHVADPLASDAVVRALVMAPDAPLAALVLVRELRSGRKTVWDLPPAELRRIIRREVARLDPEIARVRAEAARAGRHVRYHQLCDGMAELVLRGPTEVLSAAHRTVEMAARDRLRSAPDGRTIDQLRHDIAADWLTSSGTGLGSGSVSGGPPAMVNVTVGATTLLGLDEAPAMLHGPAGPTEIPADLARELAHRPELATWRRILCDPATGTAVDVSTGYRPAPPIADFVRVRDGYRSRFPVAGAGAATELDHVERFDHADRGRGGQTTAANLATAGLRDHHLKTDRALMVTGDANGPLTYRARTGQVHLSDPFPYLDPYLEPRRAECERPSDGPDPPS